eukprot:4430202-Prymnesium_polylepis.1
MASTPSACRAPKRYGLIRWCAGQDAPGASRPRRRCAEAKSPSGSRAGQSRRSTQTPRRWCPSPS